MQLSSILEHQTNNLTCSSTRGVMDSLQPSHFTDAFELGSSSFLQLLKNHWLSSMSSGYIMSNRGIIVT